MNRSFTNVTATGPAKDSPGMSPKKATPRQRVATDAQADTFKPSEAGGTEFGGNLDNKGRTYPGGSNRWPKH